MEVIGSRMLVSTINNNANMQRDQSITTKIRNLVVESVVLRRKDVRLTNKKRNDI